MLIIFENEHEIVVNSCEYVMSDHLLIINIYICMYSDLRQSRNLLLDIISNPTVDMTTLMNALNKYLGLLHGFIVSLDAEKEGGDSKLRHALRFRWTNTLLGNTPT